MRLVIILVILLVISLPAY
ncbi:type I toxin-antitoxin system Ibs family toxin [Escherichia coli]|nr:type I toxin-antitoxin system Ibs family toxin [Escherichia coli]MDD8366790.1 type I toxin-antitoxin system Ibs family toxin [Escherichia coli]MDD8398537.1 type I toxin-antitoxin system Ibs family toxin [Escherichia coli]